MEDEAKPAMEFVKSNKGRKPNGKAPHTKKQPQRGMGVAQLEHLRKMSETVGGGAGNVPVLHGVVRYGVPMVINGGSGSGSETGGLMMQRVVGNGGFSGFNGQVLVGNPGNLQLGCGVVEACKELSSMPKFQHCMPDRCDACFKKKRYSGETGKLNGGIFNQFGQTFPRNEADFHGWNLENNQNYTNEEMNGFSARVSRSAYAYAAATTGGQMNNSNETVDVLAIHKKGNSFGTGSYVMEYEFFPGKNGRNTASKEWESPQEGSLSQGGEASHANASGCVDLSLKLSY
ncbi:NOZZLE, SPOROCYTELESS [Hibiscus trionum]|nr:NOZZLE, SPOROCYTELESS [Hibiscus trionum]